MAKRGRYNARVAFQSSARRQKSVSSARKCSRYDHNKRRRICAPSALDLTEDSRAKGDGGLYPNAHWPDFDALDATETAALRTGFHQAAPFPHLVLDGFVPPEVLKAMQRDFDAAIPSDWHEYRGSLQNKRGTPAGVHLPAAVQAYFNTLYSGFHLSLARVQAGWRGA